MGNITRSLCDDRPTQRDQFLAPAEFAFNHMVNRSTGKTPFKIVYQQPPKNTLDLISFPKLPRYSSVEEHLAKKMQRVQAKVKQKLQQSNAKYKATTDQHHHLKVFAKGGLVMVHLQKKCFPASTFKKLKIRRLDLTGLFERLMTMLMLLIGQKI